MTKQELQKVVGNYCREYRINEMQVDLRKLAKDVGINYKTLYSFEIGLSSNLYLYYIYYNYATDKDKFLEGLYGTKETNN